MANDKAAAQHAKGTSTEIFVWTMPAAMIGYFAWSFVSLRLLINHFVFVIVYSALLSLSIINLGIPLKWSEEESK